jgi:hypothetical protein
MQGLESVASVYNRIVSGGSASFPPAADFTWQCHLMPISRRPMEIVSEVVQKSSHELIGEVAAILEGARIVIDGETYYVQGPPDVRKTPHKNPHHMEVYVAKRES